MPGDEQLTVRGYCLLCAGPAPPTEPVVTVRTASDGEWTVVRCTGCGLMFTDPRPSPDTMGRYYESDYYSYQFHGARPRSHRLKVALWQALGMVSRPGAPAATGPMARAVRRWVRGRRGIVAAWTLPPATAEARFLDVGCGAGERLELAADLGWQTWGVDLGEAALRGAAQRGHLVAVANAEQLPLASASFDYLNLCHVLEHLYDPRRLLAECRRLLRPGGVVQVNVPNAGGQGPRRFGPHWRAYDLPRHLYHFSADTLTRLLEAAGLRVELVRTLPDEWINEQSMALAGEPVTDRAGIIREARDAVRRGAGATLDVWCRCAETD